MCPRRANWTSLKTCVQQTIGVCFELYAKYWLWLSPCGSNEHIRTASQLLLFSCLLHHHTASKPNESLLLPLPTHSLCRLIWIQTQYYLGFTPQIKNCSPQSSRMRINNNQSRLTTKNISLSRRTSILRHIVYRIVCVSSLYLPINNNKSRRFRWYHSPTPNANGRKRCSGGDGSQVHYDCGYMCTDSTHSPPVCCLTSYLSVSAMTVSPCKS